MKKTFLPDKVETVALDKQEVIITSGHQEWSPYF